MELLNQDCINNLLSYFKQSLLTLILVNKYFNNLINEDFWIKTFNQIANFKVDYGYQYFLLLYWESNDDWYRAAFNESLFSVCLGNDTFRNAIPEIIETNQIVNKLRDVLYSPLIDIWSPEAIKHKANSFNFELAYCNNFVRVYELLLRTKVLNHVLSDNLTIIIDVRQVPNNITYLKIIDQTCTNLNVNFIVDAKYVRSIIEDCNYLTLLHRLDQMDKLEYLEYRYVPSFVGYEEHRLIGLIKKPPNLKKLYISNLSVNLAYFDGITELRVEYLDNEYFEALYQLPESIKIVTIDKFATYKLIDTERLHYQLIL